MSALRQVAAITFKDALVEWRTRDLASTTLVLGVSSVVLFAFAVDFGRVPFAVMGAPVLWLAFVYTGVSGVARSFGSERENRCLDGLLLAPVDPGVLYLAKLLFNFLVLLVLQVVLVALCLLLLNRGSGAVDLPPSRAALLLAVIAVHALGFAAVGTLMALMAQRTRRGDVLLPVLQVILTLPVVIPAVIATQRTLDLSRSVEAVEAVLQLSAVFDLVFIALAFALFEHVVEE